MVLNMNPCNYSLDTLMFQVQNTFFFIVNSDSGGFLMKNCCKWKDKIEI